jgi:hypothetical protein
MSDTLEERIARMEKACNDYNSEISDFPTKVSYIEFCDAQKKLLWEIYMTYPNLRDIKPDVEALPFLCQDREGGFDFLKWDLEWINDAWDEGHSECLWVEAKGEEIHFTYWPDGWSGDPIHYPVREALSQSQIFERFFMGD